MWQLGELTPGNQKSANNLWLPQNLPTPSCFSISMGNGFQESLGYQNPQMFKTRHRTTHIQPQIRNSTGICWKKKIRVVSGPTSLNPCCSKVTYTIIIIPTYRCGIWNIKRLGDSPQFTLPESGRAEAGGEINHHEPMMPSFVPI